MSRTLPACVVCSALTASALAPAVALATRGAQTPNPPADPYQPKTVCTALPVNIGRQIDVSTGAELQSALDAALAGDTIRLRPGVAYRPSLPEGSFLLRRRNLAAGQWIIVRSADTAFEGRGAVQGGTRVTAANAAVMGQIRTARNDAPAIKAERGARGYRLIGLDIGADPSVRKVTNLIELGDATDTTVDTEPSDIVIDRSYVHGNDDGNFRRGVAMNGANIAVLDSYFSNFHDADSDSQAIAGWNGPGPFKIVNNFLEAAGENIIFGGGDPAVANLVPADIEIRRNLSTKRLSWKTDKVSVKNAFELKNARRVLVEGNVFENVWTSGQDGTAIVLKSVNQDGKCTWCVTEYVTFRRNIVRNAENGVVINAVEVNVKGTPNPRPLNHVRFEDVLFENLTEKLLRVFAGATDLSFTHITSRSNPHGVLDPRDTADSNPRFVFSFNIVERKLYGIGTGSNEGVKTLSTNFAPFTYRQNLIVNTSAGTDQAMADRALEQRYPPTTSVVGSWNDVGFTAGTSKLASSSRFAHAGDDGRDLGADMDAIAAAQAPGRGGDGCGPMAIPRKPQ